MRRTVSYAQPAAGGDSAGMNTTSAKPFRKLVILSVSLAGIAMLPSCLPPPPGVHVRATLHEPGYYDALPPGYAGDYYLYGDRYYYGGRHELGRFRYNGRVYGNRYYHGGRYYYGGQYYPHHL